MTINLQDDHKNWLETQVALGHYASVEEAAAAAIAAAMADRAEIEADEFEWAAPFLDAARAEAADGKVMTLEEYRTRMAARLASLKG